MEALALKILIIVGGFLFIPILGCLFERYIKGFFNLAITGIFLGSLVSLAGFTLCVSWNCLCTSCGKCSALMVFIIAWLSFLFLAFSAYSTQLER